MPVGGASANNPLVDPSLSPMHSKLRNGGKGRRGGVANTPAPPSPAKELCGGGAKRKGRPPEELLSNGTSVEAPGTGSVTSVGGVSNVKRSRSSSRGAGSASPTPVGEQPGQQASPLLIECPEPNCSKKYRHINGLKYHQSHAHSSGGGGVSGVGGGSIAAGAGSTEDDDSNGVPESRKR